VGLAGLICLATLAENAVLPAMREELRLQRAEAAEGSARVALAEAAEGSAQASPATATTSSGARVFEMVRRDMRVTIRIVGRRVVHAHVRALERCGRSGAKGYLTFDLPREEAIRVREDGHFHHGETFDDARGRGTVVLEGLVHRRTIQGIFLFRNRRDRSCGTGRPGERRVHYTARLRR
jgi:hypothetical protein